MAEEHRWLFVQRLSHPVLELHSDPVHQSPSQSRTFGLQRRARGGKPSQYIDLVCYSFPVPANRLGNAGRNSLIGPGLAEFDYSVHRSFPLRTFSETATLQFRAEMFNITNRTNFEPPLPNNSLYNNKGTPLATAGVITSKETTSRQIQLALRLSW